MRKDKFGVCINATPKLEVAPFFLWLYQSASMRSDELPLFIHLDSDAWQVGKIRVHVISERFARFTDHAMVSLQGPNIYSYFG